MVLVVTYWEKKMIEAPKKIDGIGKGGTLCGRVAE